MSEEELTREQFQHRYQRYEAATGEEAQAEADRIRLEYGERPVAVGLPFGAATRWCLMLDSAVRALEVMGLPLERYRDIGA